MSNIIAALQQIDVASLSYQEWINVGMALKAEGFSCQVWDDWSRSDRRYHRGECERKWDTFHGSSSPITGATIVQMAKDRGWTPFGPGTAMDWDDVILDDGDSFNRWSDIYVQRRGRDSSFAPAAGTDPSASACGYR